MPPVVPLLPRSTAHRSWLELSFILLALGAVLTFQVWTARTSGVGWPKLENHQNDYYNLLSRGFLAGHLSLKSEPDPALLKLRDPYDPEQRAGIPVLHDVSLYHGKYYLYWGPAPAVMLFLPFRVLTGQDLPQVYGNLLFVSVGFVALAMLWLCLRRDFFAESSTSVTVIGLLALGTCGMTLSLLRRPSLWELPIAGGHAFAMVGLASAYAGLRGKAPRRWWALASLAFGLAVASRPTYAFGVGPLLLVLIWRQTVECWPSKTGFLPPARWWQETAAIGLPFGLILLSLLAYNYARFDHALEFGLKYQMSGSVELTATHFSPRYAPFNAFVYYFAPAQWSRYFPFVQLIHTRPQPVGYYGIEYTYGLLTNEPLTLLALLAPLALWRRTARERNLLLTVLVALTGYFLGIGGILLFFWAATQRYMADFASPLVLLGCLGLFSLERWSQSRQRPVAISGRWLGIAGAAISIFFGIVISFQLHGLFKVFSPETYAHLAHLLDWPSHYLERLQKFPHGPIEMDLRFPKEQSGKLEPLLSTGWEFFSDQVYVYYVDGRHLQLGFDHVSRGSRMSAPVEIDYDAIHHLRLELGSLYPPEQHPFFDGKTELERSSLTQWLRLVLDGRVVMENVQPFYEGSPGSVQIGGTTTTPAYGDRFTGEITAVRRGPYHFVTEQRGFYGPITFNVSFPQGLVNHSQPLVGAGVSGRADTLYVNYVRDGYVRFGYDHWGVGAWQSDEIEISYERPQKLQIYMPSLLRPHGGTPYSPLSDHLVLLLDEKLIWLAQLPSYPTDPSKVNIARNFAESSTCEYKFSGVIGDVTRSVEIAEPNVRRVDSVEFRLVFPRARIGKREPLFVRGTAGAADVFLVDYVDESHIQFGLDHGNGGMIEGESLAIDYTIAHTVGLRIGEVASGPDRSAIKQLSVTLDGHEIWSSRASFYPARPETVTIGENLIGARTGEEVFTGALLELNFPLPGSG